MWIEERVTSSTNRRNGETAVQRELVRGRAALVEEPTASEFEHLTRPIDLD
jgi:hypothetical protein